MSGDHLQSAWELLKEAYQYQMGGEFDEALPWLERALQSRRYDSYHYPHYNLGRVYRAKEMYAQARYHFEQALKICSDYPLAKDALESIRRLVQ